MAYNVTIDIVQPQLIQRSFYLCSSLNLSSYFNLNRFFKILQIPCKYSNKIIVLIFDIDPWNQWSPYTLTLLQLEQSTGSLAGGELPQPNYLG